MILQTNYVYVWCGNFHTDLRFRPKCIPFLNINFLLYFNFLVHRTLSIKIFSFQKFILQCKYFRHNNTVECSLWIQLPLLAPWVFSQERDQRFWPLHFGQVNINSVKLLGWIDKSLPRNMSYRDKWGETTVFAG